MRRPRAGLCKDIRMADLRNTFGEQGVEDVTTVELRNGEEVQHGDEHPEPPRERDRMDEQRWCRAMCRPAKQQGHERVTEDGCLAVEAEQQAGRGTMARQRMAEDGSDGA